jgi:hypothetical protein
MGPPHTTSLAAMPSAVSTRPRQHTDHCHTLGVGQLKLEAWHGLSGRALLAKVLHPVESPTTAPNTL